MRFTPPCPPVDVPKTPICSLALDQAMVQEFEYAIRNHYWWVPEPCGARLSCGLSSRTILKIALLAIVDVLTKLRCSF